MSPTKFAYYNLTVFLAYAIFRLDLVLEGIEMECGRKDGSVAQRVLYIARGFWKKESAEPLEIFFSAGFRYFFFECFNLQSITKS